MLKLDLIFDIDLIRICNSIDRPLPKGKNKKVI